MRQKAMKADASAYGAEEIHAKRHEKKASPAEKPRQEGEQSQQVNTDDREDVKPIDLG